MNIKYSLFTDTLCDGYIPSSTVTDKDGNQSWDLYDTLKEAQLESLDVLETHIQDLREGYRDEEDTDLCGNDPDVAEKWIEEFKAGERDFTVFQHEFELTYNAEMVKVFKDGSIQIIYDLEKKDFGRKYPPPALADFR